MRRAIDAYLQTYAHTFHVDHPPGATKMVEPDYYAVYVRRNPKNRANFLLHVHAKDKPDALRITRAHGHKL